MLEQILITGKVDLVVQGHVHNYERFAPMKFGVPSFNTTSNNAFFTAPGVPIYVACGAAGNNEGLGAPIAAGAGITGSVASAGISGTVGGPAICEFNTNANNLVFNVVSTGGSTVGKTVDTFTIAK